MIAKLFVPTAPPIGSDLDRLLAPLDDVAPLFQLPGAADAERAYAIGMLAADLTMHPPSRHLIDICAHYGWQVDDALAIARAVASLLVRIAQHTGAQSD